MLFPALRSLARASLGRRPHQRDLERMIDDVRGRLLRGRHRRPFTPPRLPPAFALRQLRRLQLRKLRRTVDYVHRYLPYYRRVLDAAGIRSSHLRSLDDLRRLPITGRTDLESARDDFLSRAPGMTPAVDLRTSGTTGKALDLFLTRDEFEYYVAVQALSGMLAGFLGPAHLLQVHLSLDTSIASRIFSAAARRTGALVFNVGVSGQLDRSLQALCQGWNLPGKLPKISGLFASPGQLWALAARAEQIGVFGDRTGLRRIFTCGAPVSDDLRQLVRRVWGMPLREAWSMVEIPGTGIFECDGGRLHFLDLSGLIEFLDPDSLEPVAPGRPGVAVVTAFFPDRELMPVIRYWTEDLMVPSGETTCACGVVSTLIDGILGRIDQMIIVGARNFFPHAMGDVLTAFPDLIQPPRFRVALVQRPEAQHVVVEIECAASVAGERKSDLTRKVREALPMARDPYITTGTVRLDVRLLPPGSIRDPFRYKLQGPSPLPASDPCLT